ncbi:MAG: hypothetical protein GOMPHAMPRED_005380 [Gomphillus americanus]|uniref:Bet v1-like protein n=1 Tax=Gomphillus americanus TaxID=1940652 RepID=A0A8H3IIL1_9LECA|nr:MAG: hypothetical protein GOMPHAMPRED_005380 [Gomphillus americanus]
MSIPTAASISESAVISAPLAQVWHLIKLKDFHSWWDRLSTSDEVKDSSAESYVVKWSFKDGTTYEVKQEEALNHYITYSIISSEPALTYTSVISTIRCYPVTSGEKEGSTFVEWTEYFSSDADAGVIQDAKFKRREALADLAKAVGKK